MDSDIFKHLFYLILRCTGDCSRVYPAYFVATIFHKAAILAPCHGFQAIGIGIPHTFQTLKPAPRRSLQSPLIIMAPKSPA